MIRIETNARAVALAMGRFADQMPYATSVAINNTALDFQARQRAYQQTKFNIKQRLWFERAVKITHFAKKQEPWTDIKIDPPWRAPDGRSDVIAQHEEGGIVRPQRGHTRFAIPAEVGRLKSGSISRAKRPKAFEFHRVSKRGVNEVYAGKNRTFMIKKPGGTGGIYQRTGRKTRRASNIASRRVHDMNLRTLYRFTPMAKLDARLDFRENAHGVVQARFDEYFSAAFDRAIASASRDSVYAEEIRLGAQARRIIRADVYDTDRSPNRRR